MVERRGLVLSVDDLHDRWIDWLASSGINVLALHCRLDKLIKFAVSENGKEFIEKLRNSGIDIEYENHVMNWILPRAEYLKPSRSVQNGRRRRQDARRKISVLPIPKPWI